MSPHFIHELVLRPLPDGRNFELQLPLGFWSKRTGFVTVPRGFKTDLASVPQLFWNIIPPFGKYDDAAVVHDWLYRTHLTSRATADATLLLGMRIKRVAFWKRWVMYLAVRTFGWACWGRKARHIRLQHNFIHSVHHD